MKFNKWCTIPPIAALILAAAEDQLGLLTVLFQFAAFFFGLGLVLVALFRRNKNPRPDSIGLGLCCIVAAFLIILYRTLFGPHIVLLPPVPASIKDRPVVL